MARLQKTLVDYVIIAITPALIMVLVGSLVHFLVEVFYAGGYQGRLDYVFSLFVFAAVLIARIAIEEGRERSILFAIPLMIATLLVMGRFVEFTGALAPFSFLINIGLLSLVLWSADRLTWDCTVIDEREDASGEGLLQTVGLDRSSADASADADSVARAAEQRAVTQDLDATSSDESPPEPEYWWDRVWQRFLDRRKRPHAPGVWVIYFSLAALPIFGIGQKFIPETDTEARGHALRLLYYYVGSGLGLLMTTSFLGLRRYLRQRRLDMPLEMTGVWLTIGSIMILALLLACAVLPRPRSDSLFTDLSFQVGSPDDLTASQYGTGSEGAEDKEQHARNAASSDEQDSQAESGPSENEGGSGQGPESEDGGASGQEKSGGQGEGSDAKGGSQQDSGGGRSDRKSKPKSGAKRKSEGGASDSESQPRDGGQSDRGDDEDDPSDGSSEDGGDQSGSDSQSEEGGEGERSSASEESGSQERPRAGRSGSGRDSSGDEAQNARSQDAPRAGSPPPRTSFSPTRLLSGLLGGFGYLLKFLYYAFFILLVGYLLWRYRTQVLEALSNFIQSIRDFWANLFGGGQTEEEAAEETAAIVAPPRPFADYEDPFVTGAAARYTPQQLLAYSFEALEAWGREHGCARDVEQTPHEYAGHLAVQRSSVGREARNLAELYCFEAFSGDTLPREQVHGLRSLWKVLRREQASDHATAPPVQV